MKITIEGKRIMKTIKLAATALMLAVGFAASSMAGTFTKGTVKKVDPRSGKVTIIHEELVDLDMPAMTMVFRLAEKDMLDQLEAGQEIEFVAERIKGRLTVTELR
ncbi:copper-binding protein [Pseudophaeobacter arcticus]|uniref:copper-binding protein n=2 Tax=Pseudophaeobacter arcticus TaxID=385492 RepID=UPI00040EBC2E|nr:copper-binding protein [Pseudophaeobacter arcticus]